MRRYSFLLIAFGAITSVTHLGASPVVDLTLNGFSGDLLTQGQNWHIIYNSPADQIKAVAYAQGYYGLELDTFGQQFMSLVISIGGYDTPVGVGSYFSPGVGVGSAPFFSFGFDGRGESDVQTEFTVNAIRTADPGPKPPYVLVSYPLEYLDVSFLQQTWQGAPAFSGRIIFDANPTPEPCSIGLTALALAGVVIAITRKRTDLGDKHRWARAGRKSIVV